MSSNSNVIHKLAFYDQDVCQPLDSPLAPACPISGRELRLRPADYLDAAPVAVDDVGAGLLPQALEDLESSLGLVLLLFIPTLQEGLCRRQNLLHLHTAIVL